MANNYISNKEIQILSGTEPPIGAGATGPTGSLYISTDPAQLWIQATGGSTEAWVQLGSGITGPTGADGSGGTGGNLWQSLGSGRVHRSGIPGNVSYYYPYGIEDSGTIGTNPVANASQVMSYSEFSEEITSLQYNIQGSNSVLSGDEWTLELWRFPGTSGSVGATIGNWIIAGPKDTASFYDLTPMPLQKPGNSRYCWGINIGATATTTAVFFAIAGSIAIGGATGPTGESGATGPTGAGGGNTIYNANDALTSDRVVNCANWQMNFNNTQGMQITGDGTPLNDQIFAVRSNGGQSILAVGEFNKNVKIGGTGSSFLSFEPSALLECYSDLGNQGFLLPRLTNPGASVSAPVSGLMAYDSTDNELQYYNGASWVSLIGGTGGIYNGSGSLISTTSVAMGNNDFLLSSTGGDFSIHSNISPNPVFIVDGASNSVAVGSNGNLSDMFSVYNSAGTGNTIALGIQGNETVGDQIGIGASVTGAATSNTGIAIDCRNGTSANYALVTVNGNSGFGTTGPDGSAIVEMSSTSQGFLLPRLDNPGASVSVPVAGLMAYDSIDNQLQLFLGDGGATTSGDWAILTPSLDTVTPTTAADTIDFTTGYSKVLDLATVPGASSAAVTLTLTGPLTGQSYTIKIIQGPNVNTLTWPLNVKWEGGTPLTAPTSVNLAVDVVTLIYDGTDYYASYGTNFS